MQPSPPQQPIAIARAKVKSRRSMGAREPQPFSQRGINMAYEFTMACVGTVFFVGLLFSTGALVTLATVSIRCLIAEW